MPGAGDTPRHGEVPAPEALDMWAPGSQLKCSGEVLRWHFQNGTQAVPVDQYIQDLEAEIRGLKQQVSDMLPVVLRDGETVNTLGQQAAPGSMRVMAHANVVHIDLQVASVQQGSFNQNEVLEYIQSLGPDAELLTANASQDVLDAMTCFVERCTGEQNFVTGGYCTNLGLPLLLTGVSSVLMPTWTFLWVHLQALTSTPTWRPLRSTMCKSSPHSCFGP